jgi:hypothetical protein
MTVEMQPMINDTLELALETVCLPFAFLRIATRFLFLEKFVC